MIVSFEVEGTPKPQPRTRSRGPGKKGVYDPGTADWWKHLIYQEAKERRAATPIEGPLRFGVVFWFQRPKGHFRKNGELTKSAPLDHIKKPDLDNLVKAVKDAISDSGLWHDDCQICEYGYIAKHYTCREHPRPGAVITIETVTRSQPLRLMEEAG